MKAFGYNISRDRQIDYDSNDEKTRELILTKEPSLSICMACGSCSATCTAGHFTSLNIRRIHTLIRRGEFNRIKSGIRNCMLCGKCQLACPRGVNLRNLILQIQKLT